MTRSATLRACAAAGVVSMLGFALSRPATAQDAAVQPQPVAIEGAASRVYKSVGGVDLRLHIFNPPNHAATTAAPAIVFFFGGGWTGGTVRQFVPQSKHFASRGMVAVVADYRVFSRHKTTAFEAIADGKSAIRWARAHARDLGIDSNRIAAAGGSSGGHVALSAAVLDGFDEPREDRQVRSKPNALVLSSGVRTLLLSLDPPFPQGDTRSHVDRPKGGVGRNDVAGDAVAAAAGK